MEMLTGKFETISLFLILKGVYQYPLRFNRKGYFDYDESFK